METKKCHSCCEEIKAEAKQCPHCQSYQSAFNKVMKSPAGGAIGAMIGVAAVIIFFSWFMGERFGNNAIYDPHETLIISESKIQFKDASCGKQVVLLGKITNNGEEVLTDIVFDIEFYDEAKKLIDSVSDTEYDLVIPPGSTKSFKVAGKSGANESQYASHKISVAKAEPDR